MDCYKIEWKTSAQKALKKIPKTMILKIIEAVNKLSINPDMVGSVKLSTEDNYYRIKVGSYRIIYFIKHEKLIIEVIKVGHRKHIYRNL